VRTFILGFIMGISGRMGTAIKETKSTLEWIRDHGVMSRRKFQNLSDNLAVALLF
jgi:hypothetical protein